MRHIGLLLVLGLASFPSSAPAAPSDDLKGYCASKWPTNYQMQLFCVQEEGKARQRVAQRGSIEPQIWTHCSRWDNWQMLNFCITQEEEAKRQLTR